MNIIDLESMYHDLQRLKALELIMDGKERQADLLSNSVFAWAKDAQYIFTPSLVRDFAYKVIKLEMERLKFELRKSGLEV